MPRDSQRRRSGAVRRYLDCARLNLRVIRLALRGRWIGPADARRSYDALAPTYEENWEQQIWPVTLDLLNRVPEPPPGTVLDLGCGAGAAAIELARRWPDREIVAVDFSPGMLAEARRRAGERAAIRFERADLLEFAARRPAGPVGLAVAAWSIGYSRPARAIAACGRILRPGGALAFVVNYADSLGAIYRAFRRTMGRFPGEMRALAWPRFPPNADYLRRALRRAGFRIDWWKDGDQPIEPRISADGRRLPWLLRTGALAGFDAMLPLSEPGPVANYFERCLAEAGPIRHHYGACVAVIPA